MTTPALVSSTIRGTTWLSRDGVRELARRQKPWVLALAGLGAAVGLLAGFLALRMPENGFHPTPPGELPGSPRDDWLCIQA